jgi:hypothetical protein
VLATRISGDLFDHSQSGFLFSPAIPGCQHATDSCDGNRPLYSSFVSGHFSLSDPTHSGFMKGGWQSAQR